MHLFKYILKILRRQHLSPENSDRDNIIIKMWCRSVCRRSRVRWRRRSTATGGRGEIRGQRACHVPGESRPRRRPRPVRVARVARRRACGDGRAAPATVAERGGHRQLRHHRAIRPAERHGGRGHGGRRARAAGHDGGRPVRLGAVRGQGVVRREKACGVRHGQLSGDQRRGPPTRPVLVSHRAGMWVPVQSRSNVTTHNHSLQSF